MTTPRSEPPAPPSPGGAAWAPFVGRRTTGGPEPAGAPAALAETGKPAGKAARRRAGGPSTAPPPRRQGTPWGALLGVLLVIGLGAPLAVLVGVNAGPVPEPVPAPAPAEPPVPAQPPNDLFEHVRVGQRYTFEMDQGAPMELVWEVQAVTDTEICYAQTVVMNGQHVGEPTELSWAVPAPYEVPYEIQGPEGMDTRRETIEVAGRRWECLVVEMSGHTTWCPQVVGFPTFPGVLKQTQGERVTMLLTRIEEPR